MYIMFLKEHLWKTLGGWPTQRGVRCVRVFEMQQQGGPMVQPFAFLRRLWQLNTQNSARTEHPCSLALCSLNPWYSAVFSYG
jgi:hypothetical protein